MKHAEAKKQFKHALDNQQTITMPKLRILMQSLNMTLESTNSREIRYLKGQIKQLVKKNKQHEEFKRRNKAHRESFDKMVNDNVAE